jgi:predicted anti-sigma-YlaC factor YlaD
MHGPIRDRLEELLNAESPQDEAARHLSSCESCAAELASMREQALLLHSLRVPEPVEPSAGFYGRVMQRIEENGVRSVWTVFTEGSFGTWLAYASLVLALLVGSWLVTTERHDGHLGSEPVIAHESPSGSDLQVSGDKAHQRDVVLVNLAAYSDGSQ